MNLFNTNSSVSGFRLDYMEIFNWGTFDREVFRISPEGNNSLLTGANASGKSTLIDALLTLLVPLKRQRFYNQSSGVERKGSRTEDSYVLGYYGNQLKLRDKSGTYSVILCSFKNNDDRNVTLFQIRYFSGEELKTIWGISRKKLTITNDFADFKNDGAWRKSFERKHNINSPKKFVEFFDGPTLYQEKMRSLFGMRSDKAFTLFNQIVGVKVLDDLDVFIRENMLDEPEQSAEDKYLELKETFENLMEAKTNIEKTEYQIQELSKIDEIARKLKSIDQKINELQQEKDCAAYWFALKTIELSEQKILECQNQLNRIAENIEQLKNKENELKDEETKLNVAIEKDEVGSKIKSIEKDIRQLEKDKKIRSDNADKYNSIVQKVNLTTNPDEQTFESNRNTAKSEKDRLQQVIDKDLAEKKRYAQNKEEEIKSEIEEKITVVQYLNEHKNNISGRVAEIRDEILDYTGATSDEIPFIGELIKVKENERKWEFAIERVLHNFALRLIVPEKYYRKVNEYVNSHNLKGRIVYQRYKNYASLKNMNTQELSENCLLEKIEFKPKSQYLDWIEDSIYDDYNYMCVSDLEEFNRYDQKAVTESGLIKSTGGKHEKDDREQGFKRQNYVLGWDNKEKLQLLKNEVKNLQSQQKEALENIKSIEKEIEEKKALIEGFSKLFDIYEKYDSIDYQTFTRQIQEKSEEKQQLEKTNNIVKSLQEKLKTVKNSLNEIRNQYDKLIEQRTIKVNEKNTIEKLCKENSDAIALMGEIDTSEFEKNHQEFTKINFDEIKSKQKEFHSNNEKELKYKGQEKEKFSREVEFMIQEFKNPKEETTKKFKDWLSDVSSLPSREHLDLIGEYQAFYQRLKTEDLVSFKVKFENYLRDTITNNVNSFRNYFYKWEDSINKTIKQLNESLKEIDFNTFPARTYIQLTCARKIDVEVKEFREMLDKAVPNLREVDSSIDGRKIHFENYIAPFIRKLNNADWRTRVMNVRTWLTYKAEEFLKETDEKRQTYESMGQLSGGEKAQLTYTILGSAIAHQFGLTKSGLDSSFRFIAIDEAFKAQDEDKARYLLSLCEQLHLQLLVVTPSDNIHIVENFISFVHYVERKGNKSILFDMPIKLYYS